jgi:putative aminopeptidase FrvX
VKDKTKVLGGDDRAGVEIMLILINDGCRDYDYLFCFDEEIGGVGSSKFANDYSEGMAHTF